MTAPPSPLAAALADRYRLERELGAGGMATVYLAEDVRHQRKVAVKVLHPELSAVLGPDRFLKEITLTASLQHPHILPLFDSGSAAGQLYYVMPFVEGEALRARLERERQLPVADAVRIASEAADALAYAHARGIVHRDIKPENILLHNGHALIADFGIALAVAQAGGQRMTQTGISLGTPQYMAPEQAMGERNVDHRADIYALGVVTYEMLAGEPPFVGPTAQAVVAKVLTETPRRLAAQRPSVPAHVELAVERALEKLPADRWATSHEFSDVLQGKVLVSGTAVRRPPDTRKQRWLAGAPWALAAMLGLGAWTWSFRRTVPVPRVLRYVLNVPAGQQFRSVGGTPVQFSPDGRAIVYSGRSLAGTQLYYRRLNELTATPLPGTEQGYNATFSPDGEWIAFASSRKTISKVSVHGSGIATIANDIDTEGLSWGRGDVVVIGTATGLFRVSANGGVPVRLTSVDSAKGENSHSMPAVLGDGRTVLFWITTRTAMTGAANASYLGLVRLDDTKVERLEGDAANPIAVVNGTLFFGRSDGTIAAAPFDPPRTKSLSAATPSLQSVMFKVTGGSVASMSTAGDLVYVHGSGDALLALLDSQGKRIGGTAEPRPYSDPRFSPDGRRVAVTIATPTRSDVWLYDVASGVLQRLTSRGSSVRPAWTHDGRRVAYLADTRDAGVSEAWWAPSDGSGPEERLFVKPDNVYLNSITFSPDGRYAVAGTNAATTGRDLYLVDLRGDRKAVPMLQSKAALTAGYEMTVARQDTLFEPMLLSANVNGQFDIAANGTFVVARPASEDPEIIVVTDWLADLRTRLGSGTGKFR